MSAFVFTMQALCLTYACFALFSVVYAHEEHIVTVNSEHASNDLRPFCNFTSGTSTADNSTAINTTGCRIKPTHELNFSWHSFETFLSDKRYVIFRALIVFGSVAAIILVYVSFRCIRLVVFSGVLLILIFLSQCKLFYFFLNWSYCISSAINTRNYACSFRLSQIVVRVRVGGITGYMDYYILKNTNPSRIEEK